MAVAGKVVAYIDSDGNIAFSWAGGLTLNGENLNEVVEIGNTTTTLTVNPGATFDFKIGDIIAGVRDMLGSGIAEIADDFKITNVINVLSSNPVVEGVKNAAMSIIPNLTNVLNFGDNTNNQSFFGWGDGTVNDDILTDGGSNGAELDNQGFLSRLGSGLLKLLPSSGNHVEAGDSGAIRSFKAWDDVFSDDDVITDSGTNGLTLGNAGYLTRNGTGGIIGNPSSGYNFNIGESGVARSLYAWDDAEAADDVYGPTVSIGSTGNISRRQDGNLGLNVNSGYDTTANRDFTATGDLFGDDTYSGAVKIEGGAAWLQPRAGEDFTLYTYSSSYDLNLSNSAYGGINQNTEMLFYENIVGRDDANQLHFGNATSTKWRLDCDTGNNDARITTGIYTGWNLIKIEPSTIAGTIELNPGVGGTVEFLNDTRFDDGDNHRCVLNNGANFGMSSIRWDTIYCTTLDTPTCVYPYFDDIDAIEIIKNLQSHATSKFERNGFTISKIDTTSIPLWLQSPLSEAEMEEQGELDMSGRGIDHGAWMKLNTSAIRQIIDRLEAAGL